MEISFSKKPQGSLKRKRLENHKKMTRTNFERTTPQRRRKKKNKKKEEVHTATQKKCVKTHTHTTFLSSLSLFLFFLSLFSLLFSHSSLCPLALLNLLKKCLFFFFFFPLPLFLSELFFSSTFQNILIFIYFVS